VTFFEPFKPEFCIAGATAAASLQEAVRDTELILLLVGHTQFKQINPEHLAGQTNARMVLDAVGGWDRPAWESAGFAYYGLGDGKH